MIRIWMIRAVNKENVGAWVIDEEGTTNKEGAPVFFRSKEKAYEVAQRLADKNSENLRYQVWEDWLV